MEFLAGVLLATAGYLFGRWGRRGWGKQQASLKKRISPKKRLEVWDRDFPASKKGRCSCCRREVRREDSWHCSHVVAEAHGGSNQLDNLVVCCPTCNLKMGTRNLLEYKAELKTKGKNFR